MKTSTVGSEERSLYLRAIRNYLAAILVSAILLLSFSLASLLFQKQSVNEITPANLQFRGDRLAFEIEEGVLRLAENCLRDVERVLAKASLESERNPHTTSSLSKRLEILRDSHPIAQHFFILQDNEVVFPPVLRFAAPRLRWASTDKGNPSHQRFVSLLLKSEKQEASGVELHRALSGYRRCYELDVPKDLKAIALARAAGCLIKMGRPMEAARTYHRLESEYADFYDENWVPYKAVSVLALDALQGGERSSLPQRLVDLHQDLTGGRWALDAERLDDLKGRVQERLGTEVAKLKGGKLQDMLGFGRTVQRALAPDATTKPTGVSSKAIYEDDGLYQVFYRSANNSPQWENRLIGFSLDMDWLTQGFLPEKQKSILPDSNSLPFKLTLKRSPDRDGGEDALESDLRISFPSILSFWELQLAQGAAASWKASIFREMFFVGGAVLMTLCILALGSILAVRITREMHLLRVQSDFLGRISHELRTPLAIIKLYAESLSGRLSEPERHKCQQLIISETERLSRLVHALIDLARIQRGVDEFRTRSEDLAKIIGSILETYGKMLGEQGFRVTAAIEESVPEVRCDREKVSQAILNLLDNARKYSSEDGSIHIRLFVRSEQVVVEIKDDGVGIPTKEHRKIFDKFYRGYNSTTKRGLGIGLYLVREIMKGHGGSLEMDSIVGHGSSFRLVFPMGEALYVPRGVRERRAS